MIQTVLLFWMGLCLGSFVNALVFRLHEQSRKGKGLRVQGKVKGSDLSITKGRSMCVHCHHTLAWNDLIPVLSWVSLGGKCRYCKKPISRQYPLVELATAVLFVISYLVWPYGWTAFGFSMFVMWVLMLTGFIALVVYDLKWMLLPNKIIFPLMFILTVWVLGCLIFFDGGLDVLISTFWGMICCGGVFWVLFQVSGGKWIGGGDVKLGFLLGALVGGPVAALGAVFLASLLGSLVAAPMIITGKLTPKTRIPFGPFLIIAASLVFLLKPTLESMLYNLPLI